MKPAALVFILLLLFALRRPLFRAYLAMRDRVTDAPPTEAESWLYRRLEE
jgi:hypothetical protein